MIDTDCRVRLTEIVNSAETLDDAIRMCRNEPSTINEHWDTLVRYGSQARTVLEFGQGFSTLAWIESSGFVTSIDIEQLPWIGRLKELAGDRLAAFVADDLTVPPMYVDLLYIDTLHVYRQMRAELGLHGRHAKVIVIHDVESFKDENALLTKQYCPGDRGLMPAIVEFCDESGYKVVEHFTNQHGLIILERP